MKFQSLLLIFILFISLFFIKVDANKQTNFDASINVQSIKQENEEYLANVLKPMDFPLTDFFCSDPINAKAALAKYLDSDQTTVFEFNSKNHWPIASLTKSMTSIITVEKIGLKKEIKISDGAASAYGEAGGFRSGEIFKSGDLLKAILLVSSNDAAEALSESFGNEEFVDLMNQKAQELAMAETAFFNSSGFSYLTQSTADDLFKMISYIYSNEPMIFEISRQKETEIFDLRTKKSRSLANINEFAGQPEFLGGKTGYLETSGRNLISVFKISNKPVAIIILGAENAFEEARKILNCLNK